MSCPHVQKGQPSCERCISIVEQSKKAAAIHEENRLRYIKNTSYPSGYGGYGGYKGYGN